MSGVSSVAIGYKHMAAINEKGECFLWGNNQDKGNLTGQIGSDSITSTYIPQKLGLAKKIVKVSLGFNFSVFLSTEGKVYTIGSNNFGCLGRNLDKDFDPVPQSIPETEGFLRIIDICAGSFHILAKTKKGSLYAWGQNIYCLIFFYYFVFFLFISKKNSSMWYK